MGGLTDLRKALAHLYPTQEDVRRIAYDAGLELAYIQFSTMTINSWHSILVEAEKHGRIEPLIKVVLNQYHTNLALISAIEVYRLTDTTETENRTIALISQKLQHVEKYLLVPYDEWPERPKNSKRSETWDILEKFKQIVRCGWHYYHCKDEQRREAIIAMANFYLDEIVRDANKLPHAERSLIFPLIETWRKVFYQTKQNPFIFLESLRRRPPFVGRDGELKALKLAGSRGSLQSVLLFGLVHSGKSSLVQKAMFEYAEDAAFVIFSIPSPDDGVISPEQVLWAMYRSLSRRFDQQSLTQIIFDLNPEGITEEAVRRICAHYSKTTLVIVVDNIDRLYGTTLEPAYQYNCPLCH